MAKYSISTLADSVEILALAKGHQEPISSGNAKDFLGEKFDLETQQLEEVFGRLANRASRYGSRYPFKSGPNYLVAENRDLSAYAALLLVSPNPLTSSLNSWELGESAKNFERSAEICLSQFFGEGTRTVNFGHPSDVGRPAEFDQAVRWLADLMNIEVGAAYRPPRKKDGGVDIFAWKSFGDGRSGVPLLMIQCTISGNYINKIGDIDIRLWSSWLSSDINPLIALAVPFEIESPTEWNEIATRGFSIDRYRLVVQHQDANDDGASFQTQYLTRLLSEVRIGFR